MSGNIYIDIDHVSKRYQRGYAIQDITLRFESGRLNLLVGANGSGKTTLLKCIMGLLHYEGAIKRHPGKIGYAPEEYVMPQFMTAMGFLRSIGRVKKADIATINTLLMRKFELLDLLSVAGKPIGQLSNGMRQKVNLIQAMIHQPEILLFDEPLSALDQTCQEIVIQWLKEEAKRKLVVVSTHYPERYKIRNRVTYEIVSGRLKQNGLD
ncbi:MAG: ABC transporter ATP-binding protein [Candidatus Izemoplasmatales bacterium]|jgi:ABC-2 type transport system ATP-binding protein|nr:ABC transporter ATP-binding protein [Candidatus Izemoplasmatales bacterium]NLF48372.1 ABC transporter ATP-binding protein [Acholeplasmataceae bacterium]MDD4355513.1 ABC transporter ATP-binding protein [Candidatus Izemoplasmatales bacterium]MDD4988285.1 ABC transporter ATP-binding protein [Candidatus Izemoplasmatales bacterium]MDD5601727.1 ABC transporter ATP-binding protein [Candidatus Izemoplasmatales bacterium]